MSHFSVLVIGEDHEALLRPFHEFECTGTDDEFVQDIDKTDELRTRYHAGNTGRYRAPDGTLHSPYDDRFYRDPTSAEAGEIGMMAGTGGNGRLSWRSRDWGDGRGYRTKIHYLPAGWEDVSVRNADVQTFRQFVAYETSDEREVPFGSRPDLTGPHKYGYTLLDASGDVLKVIDRTNPNKKWDWWELGGRYTGRLKLLPKRTGLTGRPGLMTDDASPGYADRARKGDIDWEQMRADRLVKARHFWTETRAITKGAVWDSWDDVTGAHTVRDPRNPTAEPSINYNAARTTYNNQPALKALKDSGNKAYSWEIDDNLALDLDKYLEIEGLKASSFYAVLSGENWHQRGEVGWFGMASDEMSEMQWLRWINQTIDALPDDAVLSVVDCHI